MKEIQMVLKALADGLKMVSEGINTLAAKVDQIAKEQGKGAPKSPKAPRKSPKPKSNPKAKSKPGAKKAARKKAVTQKTGEKIEVKP